VYLKVLPSNPKLDTFQYQIINGSPHFPWSWTKQPTNKQKRNIFDTNVKKTNCLWWILGSGYPLGHILLQSLVLSINHWQTVSGKGYQQYEWSKIQSFCWSAFLKTEWHKSFAKPCIVEKYKKKVSFCHWKSIFLSSYTPETTFGILYLLFLFKMVTFNGPFAVQDMYSFAVHEHEGI